MVRGFWYNFAVHVAVLWTFLEKNMSTETRD